MSDSLTTSNRVPVAASAGGGGSAPANCPGCCNAPSVFPWNDGKKETFIVMCSDVRCWVGPQAPTEAKAIEYWNRVAWFCPTISPVAQKPRTTPTANAPQGVAITGDGAGARREAASECATGELFLLNVRDQGRADSAST